MGNKTFKVLEDSDGKKYIFNDECFDRIINNIAKTSKKKKEKKITQISIIEKIANHCNITSGAVKNWKQGKNGPSDILMIKHCAEILKVDYHILLTPLDEPEETMLNQYDKEIISEIYEKLISIIYEIQEVRSEEISLEPNEQRKYRPIANKELTKKISKLHLLIDQKSLRANQKIRYKLHRIVIEMLDVVEFSIPLRWEDMCYDLDKNGIIVDYDEHGLNMYSLSSERSHGVQNQGFCYIEDEISLAKKLGITDFKEPPQEIIDLIYYDGRPEYENGEKMSDDEILQYGLNPFSYDLSNADFEINPPIIFLDTMTRIIRRVFQVEFPGIETT